MSKLGPDGNFCRFRGFTIVSAVGERHAQLWRQCQAAITEAPNASRYYATLPSESYHMTTTMLDNEREVRDCRAFFSTRIPAYQQIKESLDIEQGDMLPQFVLSGLVTERVIMLKGTISKEHQEQIEEFAARFGLSNMLPQGFHITLAYQKQHIPAYLFKEIDKELRERISHVLCRASRSLDFFELERPRLCFYNDMTKFIPWDGRDEFPFEE